MERYAGLLRGINVSGKNKIQMAALKKGFEDLSFQDVRTYLNSGNVVFSSPETDREAVRQRIETMIRTVFGLEIPVYVIRQTDLKKILDCAPDWWGTPDPDIYDNLIFILPPASFGDVYRECGEPKEGLEKIRDCGEAVFWSFLRSEYMKTNWWPKTASAGIRDALTIRTANTVRRIAGM